jgi:ABC-type phosphate transport system substrate-binding protein
MIVVAQESKLYKVIVHNSNLTKSLSESVVSDYFLKKKDTWKNGMQVHPFDLSENSDIRKNFSLFVHGRTISKIKAYWQRLIFTGRGVPPPQLEKEEDVLSFVQADSSAIGYIALSTDISKYTVKVINITE